MVEFFELGYPYLSATVTILNLFRPDLLGPKGNEIDSGKNMAWGNPRRERGRVAGCHRLLRLFWLG